MFSRHIRHLLAIFFLGALSSEAHAKASFQGKSEMIAKAEAIAIVRIDSVRETEVKGQIWTYRQIASATVVDLLKGELPQKFLLHGSETFICAQCPLATGTFLAFLKKDGNLWTGSNWHLSLRAISGNRVAWYRADESLSKMEPTAIDQVVTEIKTLSPR